jgi:predicted esterase
MMRAQYEVLLTVSCAALKHNGGGDSQTIANMVTYAVSKYGGDANRTFAVGTSSGAMYALIPFATTCVF